MALLVGGLRAQSEAWPVWLKAGGEARVRLEAQGGVGFRPDSNAYLLQRLRVDLDAAPSRWLRFSLQAEDSRVFLTNVRPAPNSQKDPLDLRRGYLELGLRESGPVGLRLGRQSLSFGEGRLVADPNWSNVGRTMDGARLTLRHGGIKIDAFSGAMDHIYTDGFDMPTPGQRFHGVNVLLERVVPRALVESYLFWKQDRDSKGELSGAGRRGAKTAGVRWVGQLPRGADYGVEMAWQNGHQAGEIVRAWAGHWVVGQTLPDARYRPRVYVEFNRASGDGNGRDGVHQAFDPLFPSSHDKFGIADQFSWTNALHARKGLQMAITPRWSFGAAYNSFWRASRGDGLYSGGKIWIASPGPQGRHLGHEADLHAQWKATRRTVVDVAVGYILPGRVLRAAGRREPFSCFALGLTQKF